MFPEMMLIFWLMLFIHNVLPIENVIIIDESGSDTLECCVDGKSPCSNLSLAFTHIEDNIEIRITSDIPLHHDVKFVNVSSIIITGYNNPTIMCDHQGGLVGNYIKQITIQNIIWDKCNGNIIDGFTDIYITDCSFQYSVNFALTLKGFGSIHINGTSFSHNSGGVEALAPSISVYNSTFYDIKYEALHVSTIDVSVTIISCSFTNNSGYGVNVIGNKFTANLLISFSTFTNNTNSSVVGGNTDITLLHNVTFYNNVVVDTSDELSEDGAAIRVYNSTVIVNGTVMFCNNKAGNNGGAVYLLNSTIFAQQGTVTFYNNTADNGGAVYIGEGTGFYINITTIQFVLNSATSYGGAIYVDLYHVHNITLVQETGRYYGRIGNIASTGDKDVYIHTVFDQNYFGGKVNCDHTYYVHDTNALAYVNSTAKNQNQNEIQIWFHNLQLYPIAESKCFHDITYPISCTFCCDYRRVDYGADTYDCIIDSAHRNFTIVSNDTAINCSIYDNEIYLSIMINGSKCEDPTAQFSVNLWWNDYLGSCDIDISHVAVPGHGCMPLSCEVLNNDFVPVGVDCDDDCYFSSGYWNSNGFYHYVYPCPSGHCNQYHSQCSNYNDSDDQCNHHWSGFSCGKCDIRANFTIEYDTTYCVSVDDCLAQSLALNLLLLLSISFLYWCVVISFIFFLLHFQFDVTAGYAYSVIFYYSVLLHLVDMFNTSTFTSPYTDRSYVFDDRIQTYGSLPFFSIIGTLRPPFLQYLRICLGGAERIDHVFLAYIHPLIVTCLVVLIFIASRRFVLVARYVGGYINSKSICLLLLLSYSSVCCTSVQLLKPLAVYANKYDDSVHIVNWHAYLSPAIPYFHDRHMLYGIIAILCELIIGIGLPLIILAQRYLIRYFNLKLISIKPVIDQLQGCYKEEYRWFAAYYLICRQVIYGTDIIVTILSLIPNAFIIVVPSSYMLVVCLVILIIHVWLRPYKNNSLNAFDTVILLVLVLVVCSGFWLDGLDSGDVEGLTMVPLLFLINYLALSSKFKHVLIPCSCGGMICITVFFVFGTFRLLFLLIFGILFLVYVFLIVKHYYVKKRCSQTRYVMVNEQVDEFDSDSDILDTP